MYRIFCCKPSAAAAEVQHLMVIESIIEYFCFSDKYIQHFCLFSTAAKSAHSPAESRRGVGAELNLNLPLLQNAAVQALLSAEL